MSLFGAKRQLNRRETLKKAKENFEERMSTAPLTTASSSHIGDILDKELDKITGPVSFLDPDGTAKTSETAHELSQLDREDQLRDFHGTAEYEGLVQGEEQDRFEMGLHQPRIEDDLRRRENSQATP
jgi:hypothetical protein